jgi:hypothetical protein
MNHKNVGSDQEFYNPPENPFGRGISHLFSILLTEPMPTAVFPLPMSLLASRGLPVTSLGLPVNSAPPQGTALRTTICLPPPAPPTYVKPQTATAATNLYQKQNKMASDLQTARSHDKNRESRRASDCLRSSLSKPEGAASGFPFYPLKN